MSKFIRVTKDNRNKDRGFIAVDAICAVFENQDSHNTEIMTMDGFWYEVVDGVETVYSKVTEEDNPKSGQAANVIPKKEDDKTLDKFQFAKHRRFVSLAVSEDSVPKNHEAMRLNKRRRFAYPKGGYGQKRFVKKQGSQIVDFPSGEGEGQHGSRTKAEDFTPPETDES